ncbi:hypothetical protein L6452_10301 [Arctium lappa]|uniref:Uncharacterized protein n=1 Tax=Arctium lappa TaxID=4217 RepID=A0ACB9DME9_ARCLA|nr:hypothetical protein L6452_10301 [Arctium lappa]
MMNIIVNIYYDIFVSSMNSWFSQFLHSFVFAKRELTKESRRTILNQVIRIERTESESTYSNVVLEFYVCELQKDTMQCGTKVWSALFRR